MDNFNVKTLLNYLEDSTISSLYRNGKVYTFRDHDGNDSNYHGALVNEQEVIINDARNLSKLNRKRLDAHGFELFNKPLESFGHQFFDNNLIVQEYYPECEEIVRQETKAAHVFAFDYNIRWPKGKYIRKRIKGGQQVQAPLHYVHGDYTLHSVRQRMRYLAVPPDVKSTLYDLLNNGEALVDNELIECALAGDKRYAFINVWRSIDEMPVSKDPLALCDGSSKTNDDLVVLEIHYNDRIGENYFTKYSPSHKWWYYPLMTKDEVLLIKQWDSDGLFAQSGGQLHDLGSNSSPSTFSFHTAFEIPNSSLDTPERKSIEVRCIAMFD